MYVRGGDGSCPVLNLGEAISTAPPYTGTFSLRLAFSTDHPHIRRPGGPLPDGVVYLLPPPRCQGFKSSQTGMSFSPSCVLGFVYTFFLSPPNHFLFRHADAFLKIVFLCKPVSFGSSLRFCRPPVVFLFIGIRGPWQFPHTPLNQGDRRTSDICTHSLPPPLLS